MPTSTEIAQLKTARGTLVTALVTATASPKPNYSVDGQSFSHDQYRDSLIKQIKDLDALINMSEGPAEVVSRGVT